MESKLLEIIIYVYLDLLKKANADTNHMRTFKLIYSLINKKYIVESYSLIRTLYEEILYDLAMKADEEFSITYETSPGEIRDKVIKNINKLFNGLIDENYIKDIYNYLSKMTHECSIKELLKDMLGNKMFANFMNINATYMLLILAHFYLSSMYAKKEEQELIDYLLVMSTFALYKEVIKLNAALSQDERERYSNYFIDIKDKNYVKKANKELLTSMDNLNDEDFGENVVLIVQKVDELLVNYNYHVKYKKLFDQLKIC